MIRLLSVLTVSGLLLSGCASWPESGRGGFAEHHLQTLGLTSTTTEEGSANSLEFEVQLLSRHLDVLVLEGAELCFPATVVQAKKRQDRITREIAGGLSYDAANDMVIQTKLLARLERQLDYVRKQAVCDLPIAASQQTPGELGDHIYQLLNRDNQFAFGSAEINPKYIGHLSEAAALLLQHQSYQLRITGHADGIGIADSNKALSMARAEQVARYLQIFGLPLERMAVDAVGSDSPLFEGLNPETRLVNRRVSIELVESTTPLTVTGVTQP